MEQLKSHVTDLREIYYWDFLKIFQEYSNVIKI